MASALNQLSSSGNVHRTCWNPDCSNENSATKRCSRCRQAMYCDVGCQTSHWPQHKSVCQLPAQVDNSHSNSSIDLDPDEMQRHANLYQMITFTSSQALNDARKCASLGLMADAVDYLSFMISADQKTFLQEMEGNEKWNTFMTQRMKKA